jgi:hypothetical protein
LCHLEMCRKCWDHLYPANRMRTGKEENDIPRLYGPTDGERTRRMILQEEREAREENQAHDLARGM